MRISEPDGNGLDFADARDRFDFTAAVVVPTYPCRGGRPRFIAIGWLDDHLRALVFSPLGTEALSIIIFPWPAGRKGRSMTKREAGPIGDAEEARIQAMIARDPDAPEVTDEQAAQVRPFAEVFPDLHAAIRRGRGRPPAETRKVAIKLRLDPDTIAAFRATGPGWQTRINEVLGEAVKAGLPKAGAS